MVEEKELIFVYNADSSVFEQMKDFAHKSVSPRTYQCDLCGLTYGVFGMKQTWKKFINDLGINVDFLHKDEFLKLYKQRANFQFPAVFIKSGRNIKKLISSQEINELADLESLEKLVLSRTLGIRKKI